MDRRRPQRPGLDCRLASTRCWGGRGEDWWAGVKPVPGLRTHDLARRLLMRASSLVPARVDVTSCWLPAVRLLSEGDEGREGARRSVLLDERGASRGELGVDRAVRGTDSEGSRRPSSSGVSVVRAAGNLCAEGLMKASRSRFSANDEEREEGAETDRDRTSMGPDWPCVAALPMVSVEPVELEDDSADEGDVGEPVLATGWEGEGGPSAWKPCPRVAAVVVVVVVVVAAKMCTPTGRGTVRGWRVGRGGAVAHGAGGQAGRGGKRSPGVVVGEVPLSPPLAARISCCAVLFWFVPAAELLSASLADGLATPRLLPTPTPALHGPCRPGQSVAAGRAVQHRSRWPTMRCRGVAPTL